MIMWGFKPAMSTVCFSRLGAIFFCPSDIASRCMSLGKCALTKSLPEARTQNQILRRCKWETKDPSAHLNSLMNTSEKHRLSDKWEPSGEMDSTPRTIGGQERCSL